MSPLERVQNTVAGKPVDRLPAQPMVMMLAAKHLGVSFLDYTRDGRLMAAGQLKISHIKYSLVFCSYFLGRKSKK